MARRITSSARMPRGKSNPYSPANKAKTLNEFNSIVAHNNLNTFKGHDFFARPKPYSDWEPKQVDRITSRKHMKARNLVITSAAVYGGLMVANSLRKRSERKRIARARARKAAVTRRNNRQVRTKRDSRGRYAGSY